MKLASEIKCCPPTNDHCQLGPLAREDLRQQLHQQVKDSVAAGAKLLCGGSIPTGDGWYYPLTILECDQLLPPDQETFGPVLTLQTAASEQQAITLLANSSPYGLGALFSPATKPIRSPASRHCGDQWHGHERPTGTIWRHRSFWLWSRTRRRSSGLCARRRLAQWSRWRSHGITKETGNFFPINSLVNFFTTQLMYR